MNGRVQGLSRIHTTGCVFPLLLLYLFLPSEWHKCSWNISKWRQCGPRCQILITVADETEEEKEKRGGRERGCESCSGEQTHTFNAVHLCTLSKNPTPPHPKKRRIYVSKSPLCICRCSGIPKKTNKREGKMYLSHHDNRHSALDWMHLADGALSETDSTLKIWTWMYGDYRLQAF